MDLAFQGLPLRKEVCQPCACWHRLCPVPQILTTQQEGKRAQGERDHLDGHDCERDRLKCVLKAISHCVRDQKEVDSNKTDLKCEVQPAYEESRLGQSSSA